MLLCTILCFSSLYWWNSRTPDEIADEIAEPPEVALEEEAETESPSTECE